MGLRKPEEFLTSLQDGREVYYRGKLVEDVISHPVLKSRGTNGASGLSNYGKRRIQ